MICYTQPYASPAVQLNKDGSGAKLLKSAVVKTPLSVYEATAGRELYRPVQTTPVSNFFLAGCFTKQKYLASMEGATFSGKLAARALSDAAIAGTVSFYLTSVAESRTNVFHGLLPPRMSLTLCCCHRDVL